MSNSKETRINRPGITGPGVGSPVKLPGLGAQFTAIPKQTPPDVVVCDGAGGSTVIREVYTVRGGAAGTYWPGPEDTNFNPQDADLISGGGAGGHVGPSQLKGFDVRQLRGFDAAERERLHREKMEQIERDIAMAEANLDQNAVDQNRVTTQLTDAIRLATSLRQATHSLLERLIGPLDQAQTAGKTPASLAEQASLLRHELDEAYRLLLTIHAAV